MQVARTWVVCVAPAAPSSAISLSAPRRRNTQMTFKNIITRKMVHPWQRGPESEEDLSLLPPKNGSEEIIALNDLGSDVPGSVEAEVGHSEIKILRSTSTRAPSVPVIGVYGASEPTVNEVKPTVTPKKRAFFSLRKSSSASPTPTNVSRSAANQHSAVELRNNRYAAQ